MSSRRSTLGRGLGALIGPSDGESRAPAAAPSGGEAGAPAEPPQRRIRVAAIAPNPDQPRRLFDPDQLSKLSESIRRYGVLQPVVVREIAPGQFELLVGERRWRASQAAGVETIPAVVADVDPDDRLAIALVENVQRHDLNPLELAQAFETLAEGGATQDEIGAAVGLDRSSVANHLRLLDLPLDVQSDVESGRIAMGHAKALLQSKSPERVRHLRDRVVREGLSVRATEQLVRELVGAPTGSKSKRRSTGGGEDAAAAVTPAELQPLAEALRQHLQTQSHIRGSAARGRIEIEYFSAEDLERICNTILDGL